VIKRLVVAVGLLVVALFLGLLARDAWHWERAMSDADARASIRLISPEAWEADTTLPHDPARHLLDLEDDIAYRATMMRGLAFASSPLDAKTLKQRAITETALQRVAADTSDPERASRAADLLGVLRYSDPASPDQAENAYEGDQSGQSVELTPEQKAMAQFLEAVRVDPHNDNAQRNLELLLRQPQPPPRKGTPQAGGGDRAGRKGSGAQAPGHGY
jgi:hypothetical protein